MTAAEKIEKMLIYLSINAKVFSEKLGYERPQIIYDIQKGKTKRISAELADKIVSVFTEINKSWLLADEGEMLKDASNNAVVGEVSGINNMVGTTINQRISENKGQNAGRDIHNYGARQFFDALEAQRLLAERQLEVYSASLEQKDEQIRAAQSQLDILIRQNQEQFNRFMSMLEAMHKTKTD